MKTVLLLSGGLDSTSVAAWKRPDYCLVIDYGQNAAVAELAAARVTTNLLGLELHELRIDSRAIGQGTLAGQSTSPHSKWDEFWPYRNQLLVTFAAGWAIQHDAQQIWTGTVNSDDRHVDGTSEFYRRLSALLQMQEGALQVDAPAIHLTCHALIELSGISDEVLSWTHSCHVGTFACGNCAGCQKRLGALATLGRLTGGDA